MTYDQLLKEIRDIFMQADVSAVKEHIAYQFNIEGEVEGAFYAEVTDGQLIIEPYEYFDRDVLFTMTADTLLQIAKGEADAVEAFTAGKLKVEGDFDKALLLGSFSKSNEKAEKNTEKKTVKKPAKPVKTPKQVREKKVK